MARFVFLSFDDNAEAEAFAEAFQEGQGKVLFATKFLDDDPTNESGAAYKVQEYTGNGAVVAMFFKPTQFCHCGFKKGDAFGRGKKYGLFVHTACGKPNAALEERGVLDSMLTSFGYNLMLPEAERVEAFGAGAKKYWEARR